MFPTMVPIFETGKTKDTKQIGDASTGAKCSSLLRAPGAVVPDDKCLVNHPEIS